MNLKDELIRLGNRQPKLRPHLKAILDDLTQKTAAGTKIIDDVAVYGRMGPDMNTYIITEGPGGYPEEEVLPRGFYSWKDAVRWVKKRYDNVVEMRAV